MFHCNMMTGQYDIAHGLSDPSRGNDFLEFLHHMRYRDIESVRGSPENK